MCIAVLMGAIAGAMSFCLSDRLPALTLSAMKGDKGALLLRSFGGTSLLLIAVGLSGLCPVGQPLAVIVLAYRGLGLGSVMTELYAGYGAKSAWLPAAAMLPGAVISSVALIIAAREAFAMSRVYLRYSLSIRQTQGAGESVKLYGAKLLMLEAAMALSACADVVMAYLLAKKL